MDGGVGDRRLPVAGRVTLETFTAQNRMGEVQRGRLRGRVQIWFGECSAPLF
jgi:hypothetical protein